VRIAFYRADRGTWIDRLIGSYDRGPYSHVELVFSNGVCFSSSYRDGGTRFKQIDLDDGKWDVFDLPRVSDSDEDDLWLWCRDQAGVKYDLIGVLAFKLPFRQDGRRWFCSEVCSTGLIREGAMARGVGPGRVIPHRTTPNGLARVLRAAA
jgi:hypothetical protein